MRYLNDALYGLQHEMFVVKIRQESLKKAEKRIEYRIQFHMQKIFKIVMYELSNYTFWISILWMIVIYTISEHMFFVIRYLKMENELDLR